MKKLVAGAGMALALSTAAAQAGELSVGLTTWVGYGLLHLAEERGFFDAEGVDVTLLTTQDKPSTAAALTTGRLDGWATTADTFIFYDAKKLGLKQVVAVDFSTGGDGMVAKDDIKTVADLKGRTVGAEEGSSTYFFLLNLLADNGMTIKDIDLQPMRSGDAGAAFVAGQVDAAATWEPWLTNAVARGGHKLATSADKPGLIVDTVAFRDEVLEKQPQDVVGFIRGYFAAYDFWTAHPDEANAIMAKAMGIPEKDFIEGLAGLTFVSREANQEYIGSADGVGRIQSVIDNGVTFYRDLGILKSGFAADEVVSASSLTEALAQ